MAADISPDSSAVRTALWRALHVELDAPPHLIEDDIGLALADPEDGWRDRGQRLNDLGYGVPDSLRLVPVDFEAHDDWWQALLDAQFDPAAPAVVSSSGVSMYITEAATDATMRQLAVMAPGSVVVMTFMLPLELVDDADRPGLAAAARGAQASGTPWISFYEPERIVGLARAGGFADVRYLPTDELADRYLGGRTDGLRAAGGEGILLART